MRVLILVRRHSYMKSNFKELFSAVGEFLCPSELWPPPSPPLPDHLHGHRLADGHDRLHHHPHQRLQALPCPLCEFILNWAHQLPFFSDQQTPDYFLAANAVQQHEPWDCVQGALAVSRPWQYPFLCRQRYTTWFLIVFVFFVIVIVIVWMPAALRNILFFVARGILPLSTYTYQSVDMFHWISFPIKSKTCLPLNWIQSVTMNVCSINSNHF